MKKEEFIRAFVTQFLASWAATNFTDYCARGRQESLEDPPVEDAFFLAEKHWEKVNGYREL